MFRSKHSIKKVPFSGDFWISYWIVCISYVSGSSGIFQKQSIWFSQASDLYCGLPQREEDLPLDLILLNVFLPLHCPCSPLSQEKDTAINKGMLMIRDFVQLNGHMLHSFSAFTELCPWKCRYWETSGRALNHGYYAYFFYYLLNWCLLL